MLDRSAKIRLNSDEDSIKNSIANGDFTQATRVNPYLFLYIQLKYSLRTGMAS